MKKIFTLFTTIMIFLSMSLQCYAADLSSSGSVQRVHILEAADSSLPTVQQRAVVAPTSYAPNSYYNVQHNWTATKYTYSSYIFDTSEYPYLDIAADVPFSVEFYAPDGTFMVSVTPEYDSEKGKYYGAYYFFDDEDYYMIIRNGSSSPISSGAWYMVGDVW
ncbi:MAG TPA: hypothetical protein VJY54_05500 [Lachnospiraceae bacterium]|nr:hypothetical protein [Lachnospiraceae bacterium]